MKKVGYLLASLLVFSSAAFAVDNKTAAGAIVGGVAGAVIGNEVGGEKGAVIGAAIGGVTGAVIASDKNSSMKPRVVAAPVTQPVVVQVKPEGDHDHDGEVGRHRDNGNHYGQRKHHKNKGKHKD